MIPLAAEPSAAWKERYETLRRHFVEERQILAAAPLGLVRVCRQGVAGWMRGWADGLSCEPASPTPQPPLPQATTSLWQEQLTRLLAQMTAPFLDPAP